MMKKLMRSQDEAAISLDALSDELCAALLDWGMYLYGLGQHVVADIEEIKCDGRLIILNDQSRWEIDSVDADIADMWTCLDKVVVIDDRMYKLDESESVEVSHEL